jgi:hypothetical protein
LPVGPGVGFAERATSEAGGRTLAADPWTVIGRPDAWVRWTYAPDICVGILHEYEHAAWRVAGGSLTPRLSRNRA